MSNKALFITGGSRGIGAATAELFLKQGYDVVNFSRSPSSLKGATNFIVDLSIPGALDVHAAAISELAKRYSEIALVHNAGVIQNDNAIEMDAIGMARVLQINVVAPAALNSVVLPFVKPGSSVIYVGSTLSEKGVPNACSYVTSKHAVVGLMRSTCQDLVGKGVHTACVCPGFTETDMLKGCFGGSLEDAGDVVNNNAFGRVVQPKEIAEAIFFCAQNPAINGTLMHAHLGQIEV